MHPALSIPEVRWFVRGPKVAIFEMPERDGAVDVDVSELAAPAAQRPLKADQTEEIAPEDILAEMPAEFAPDEALELRRPDTPNTVLARAAMLEREDMPTVIRAYKAPRAGWLVAVLVGATFGLVLATALSLFASAPIARAPHPHVKAQAIKALTPNVAALGAVVPTVSIESLPRAR
jgi:hypothetical protein